MFALTITASLSGDSLLKGVIAELNLSRALSI
jgi:hypothetical protein